MTQYCSINCFHIIVTLLQKLTVISLWGLRLNPQPQSSCNIIIIKNLIIFYVSISAGYLLPMTKALIYHLKKLTTVNILNII